MRKLGLIGGLSWTSTALYYEAINKEVARRMGGLHSAPLAIESLDLAPIVAAQDAGDWNGAGDMLTAAAGRLAASGAEGIVLCSNMAHKYSDGIERSTGLQLIHIGHVTADRLAEDGVKRAGLLGTRQTMTDDFYRAWIESRDIEVATPEPAMMDEIDRIIFEELVLGKVSRISQRTLKTAITNLAQTRNQAVILACTELVMLVDPLANVLPVYDTTALHAHAAVDWIMG
ncbi:aspartate/glutamate racemase family protein [Allosphingosinicella vermicomposti]|uniref:aspartate/glutamate racemase family protein n=1 Tax=Allosphingosinicella vermicomposti TaxID=614671 RepID=UPI00131A546F|nr:amino acid racemase [Allosphingosinicella vermicomposti]